MAKNNPTTPDKATINLTFGFDGTSGVIASVNKTRKEESSKEINFFISKFLLSIAFKR